MGAELVQLPARAHAHLRLAAETVTDEWIQDHYEDEHNLLFVTQQQDYREHVTLHFLDAVMGGCLREAIERSLIDIQSPIAWARFANLRFKSRSVA